MSSGVSCSYFFICAFSISFLLVAVALHVTVAYLIVFTYSTAVFLVDITVILHIEHQQNGVWLLQIIFCRLFSEFADL